jgi:uncharacterized protein (TIGR02246 family)
MRTTNSTLFRDSRPASLRVAAMACILASFGCDRGESPVTARELVAPDGPAVLYAASVPGQFAGASEVARALDAAWAAQDADAYAANYTTDTNFIAPIGAVFHGRAAVRDLTFGLFNGPFRGSARRSTVTDVLFLTGTLALVELRVEVTGFPGVPPGLSPTAPGLLRTQERLVIARRGVGWQILAGQITAVTPGAAALQP